MARQLSVGENLTVDVDPTLHYSPTNLLVFPSEVYEFSASGKWADASNDCDADGWMDKMVSGSRHRIQQAEVSPVLPTLWQSCKAGIH